MNTEKMIEQNKIAEFIVGSRLYGTNNENSDIDYAGIFIEPIGYLFSPFKNIEEIDLSFKSKRDDGKNDKDAIDKKFYAFQKFIKLSYDNNPNILEMLFINDENIIFNSPIYKLLRNNTHLFLNKNLFKKFYGYAISQEHKMYVKGDKIQKLLDVYNILKIKNDKSKLADINELKNNFTIYNKSLDKLNHNNDDYLMICESYELPLNLHVKDAISKIDYYLSKASYRSEFIFKKGYDYKFGSHVVRLLDEEIDLATNFKLTFPLNNSQEIKSIKEGLVDINDLKNIIEKRKLILEQLELDSKLPNYGENMNAIEVMVMNIYQGLMESNKE